MARIRTVKPDFFTSEDICALTPYARLLYIGLWCEADREGRLVWQPKTFKRRYLPDDNCDADAVCMELLARDLVRVYGDDDEYAYIPTFLDHQKPNPREAKSTLPTPDVHAANLDLHASNPDAHAQGGKEGKGKEGKEYSVPNGTDAPDAASVVFGQGLAWMMKATGKPESQCRSQLGKWRGMIGDAALIEVLGKAQGERPIDAMAWLEKAVAARQSGPKRKPWEKPPADALPTEEPWEARMKGWREKRFWMAATWGPPPGESGCRVPSQFRSAA